MRHANTLTRKVEIFVASCYILSNGLDTSSLVVKQQVERASIVGHTLEHEITAQAAEVGGVGMAVGPHQCVVPSEEQNFLVVILQIGLTEDGDERNTVVLTLVP